MLASSGRILERTLKAGKIRRDIDCDEPARELAKRAVGNGNPEHGSDLSAAGYADLKHAFDDRNLPDWTPEPHARRSTRCSASMSRRASRIRANSTSRG